MKRFTIGVVCISGSVLGPACQAIVGIEDRVEADAGVTTPPLPGTDAGLDQRVPDLDPDAEPPRGCPPGCLPPAPTGWSGPSATYDGAESGAPTGCPATYTEKSVEAHIGMSAAPATCDCGTAVVTGRTCTAPVVTFPNSSCTDGTGFLLDDVSAGFCYTTNSATNSYYKLDGTTLVPGTCTFPNAKTTLPPPTFSTVLMACSLPQATACEGRADCVTTPMPAQPFSRRCIHKDGEESCPSLDYPLRFLANKKIDDARACTACTATPTGGSCGTQWGNQTDLKQCDVAGSPTDKTVGGCYSYPGTGTIIDAHSIAPSSATCSPSGGAPTGNATSLEPVTFCCNQ